MSEQADDTIIERIRRLLMMAQDVSSPNEAAIAARRAESMLRKYNLDRAEVLIEKITRDDIKEFGTQRFYKTMTDWAVWIATGVSNLYECQVLVGQRPNGMCQIMMAGEETDAQAASYTFAYLFDAVHQLSKKHRKLLRKKYGAGHGIDMDSYRVGVAQELCLSLIDLDKERRDELAKHVHGKALVVKKQELVRARYRDRNTYTPRETKVTDYSQYEHGREDGRKVKVRKIQ